MKFVLTALVAIVVLAGCGKKAPLRPPEPEQDRSDGAAPSGE